MENKYLIYVEEFDAIECTALHRDVVATADADNPNLLWCDDAYGQVCCTYLSDHPEALPAPAGLADYGVIECDIFKAPADYIVHQVNCRGVMGAGLAKQVRILNPKLYDIYQSHCRNYKPTDLLGKSFIYNNIISVFGQLNYGRDKSVVYTDYAALKNAFCAIHKRLPIDKSIAFPHYMGCGLGNGDWRIVRFLIEHCFPGREVYICKKEVK
jgi:O-acetyl-ADP-ribose deacetylase (regulator of RNase III)